jgi:Ni/Fe-hydrogenase subunit HybB-like protein
MKLPKLTHWRALFLIVMAFGLAATVVRFTRGLGASTNLSDKFPWGLWIGFDLLCGVMLAAGGFTLTAIVHLFNIEKFDPIVRPAILTAYMGYLLVCAALMFDLGRPWNIWHVMIFPNHHSVMFEVGWCVILYTAVLTLEFSPIVFDRFGWKKAKRIQRFFLIPLVIAGVLLSSLHQSSLGTVYLIEVTKLHPFWYSPALPFFFFTSAVAVGLAMTIFESSMSSKYCHKALEVDLLQTLGKALLVVLGIYGILRFEDLLHRGVLPLILDPGKAVNERNFFLLEVALALVIPIIMLSIKVVRESPRGLFIAAVSSLLGFVTNRLNIAVTGMERGTGVHYFPKWTEWSVTFMFVALSFAIFALAVRYLPIFEEEHHTQVVPVPARAMHQVAAVGNATAD